MENTDAIILEEIDLITEQCRNNLNEIDNLWHDIQKVYEEFNIPPENVTRPAYLTLSDEYSKMLQLFDNKRRYALENFDRNEIKIYLFGSVSAGKSSVANAMVGRNVFFPDFSQSTACFTEIMAGDEDVMRYKDKEGTEMEKTFTADSLDELCTIGDTQLSTDAVIKLSLSLPDHQLLTNDTVLVDIPGIGSGQEIMDHVNRQSCDSNILVFVLTNVVRDNELKFFKFQSKYALTPDIFVLVNKWDETDRNNPKKTQQGKNDILRKCTDLVRQYNIDEEEAGRRIFFVSASEVMDPTLDMNSPQRSSRKEEFDKFMKSLSDHVEQTRRNKLQRKTDELNKMLNAVKQLMTACQGECRSKLARYSNKPFDKAIQKIDRKISDVEKKIDDGMQKIRKISKSNHTNAENGFSTLSVEIAKDISAFMQKLLNDFDTNQKELLHEVQKEELSPEVKAAFTHFLEWAELQNDVGQSDDFGANCRRIIRKASRYGDDTGFLIAGVLLSAVGAALGTSIGAMAFVNISIAYTFGIIEKTKNEEIIKWLRNESTKMKATFTGKLNRVKSIYENNKKMLELCKTIADNIR